MALRAWDSIQPGSETRIESRDRAANLSAFLFLTTPQPPMFRHRRQSSRDRLTVGPRLRTPAPRVIYMYVFFCRQCTTSLTTTLRRPWTTWRKNCSRSVLESVVQAALINAARGVRRYRYPFTVYFVVIYGCCIQVPVLLAFLATIASIPVGVEHPSKLFKTTFDRRF